MHFLLILSCQLTFTAMHIHEQAYTNTKLMFEIEKTHTIV